MSEFTYERLRENLERLIQMSGFPMRKGIDGFDFSFQPSIDKRQIDELCTVRFLENAENVVFLGPPGVGIVNELENVNIFKQQAKLAGTPLACVFTMQSTESLHKRLRSRRCRECFKNYVFEAR